MKLYSTVRALRCVVLGAAKHSPSAVVITEFASMASLFQTTTRTLGGIFGIAILGHVREE